MDNVSVVRDRDSFILRDLIKLVLLYILRLACLPNGRRMILFSRPFVLLSLFLAN